LATISADLSKLAAPGAYKLVVSLKDSSVENDWNFWLYPAQVDTNTPSDVLVTRNWSEAATKLAAGGKVLFMPIRRRP
jgi:beta-galactosidase